MYTTCATGVTNTGHVLTFITKLTVVTRGVTILQILDSITFSILRSRFDSILDFYMYLFFFTIFRLDFYAI